MPTIETTIEFINAPMPGKPIKSALITIYIQLRLWTIYRQGFLRMSSLLPFT